MTWEYALNTTGLDAEAVTRLAEKFELGDALERYVAPEVEPGSVGDINRAGFSFWRNQQSIPNHFFNRPLFNERCIHQWEHDRVRYASTCSLCGEQLTELDAYRGLRSSMSEVYKLCSYTPKVNQGALVAKVWEEVVGKAVDHNLFNSSPLLEKLDVTRIDVFDRGDVYDLFDRDDPKGVPGVAARVNLLANARKKLINQQTRRLLEDGRR